MQKLSEKNVYYILIPLVFLLGLYLRLKLLLFGAPFQTDEGSLAINILEKGYKQLLLPLGYYQISPPAFLLISKLVHNIANYDCSVFFSDLSFRLIPFISGVLSIPALGYLLYKLFNNKFVTLLGMFVISIIPSLISYSCIFKQYSTETLVLILMLIAFMKIDFKNKSIIQNITLMSLLGIASFFSLTAVFVYPGGFLYVILKNFNKDCLKKFCICIIPFFILFMIYVIFSLLPMCQVHYAPMYHAWNTGEKYNIINFAQTTINYIFRTKFIIFSMAHKQFNIFPIIVMFLAGSVLLLKNNFKQFILCFSPFFVTYLFVYTGNYAVEERVLIFLAPVIITISLYTIIPIINIKRNYIITFVIFALLSLNYILNLSPQYVYYIHKFAMPSKQIWDYWKNNYNNDGTVILGNATTTGMYYLRIYGNKSINYLILDSIDNIPKLEKGTYYLIVSSLYSKVEREVEALLNQDNIQITDVQLFSVPTSTDYIRRALYIKFIKE